MGAVSLLAAVVAGCTAPGAKDSSSIAATAAYVQAPAAPGAQTVGYLDIRNNGPAADRLESVTTSVGGTVKLRGPVQPGGYPLVMHTVADIAIPPGAMTQLVPNSYHLILTGEGPLVDGKAITLRLRFARAGVVTILALVTNPNDSTGPGYGTGDNI
jgi:periplasmic copper chaperone A